MATKENRFAQRVKEESLEASLRLHPLPAANLRHSPSFLRNEEATPDREQVIAAQVLRWHHLQPSELLTRQVSEALEHTSMKQPLSQDSSGAFGTGATEHLPGGETGGGPACRRGEGQEALEAEQVDRLLERSAQLLGIPSLTDMVAREAMGCQGTSRQRLLEQMLALYRTQEELMLARLRLMSASGPATAAQAPGLQQALPGLPQAQASSSRRGDPGTYLDREEHGLQGFRAEERSMSVGFGAVVGDRSWPAATASTLQNWQRSAVQSTVKHERPSPPPPDREQEQEQGQHKSWMARESAAFGSHSTDGGPAEVDPWSRAQTIRVHRTSLFLDRGVMEAPALPERGAECRGTRGDPPHTRAGQSLESHSLLASSGCQREEPASLDEVEDAAEAGKGSARVNRGFLGPMGDVIPAAGRGSTGRRRQKEAASKRETGLGRAFASPAAAAPAAVEAEAEAADEDLLATGQTELRSQANKDVPGGLSCLVGGASDERGGMQSSRLDVEQLDLNAPADSSGRLRDQLAEVLEKLVTRKGAGASDTNEGCPVHNRTGPDSAPEVGTGPDSPSSSWQRPVCTCAGVGMADPPSPRSLGMQEPSPIRLGSKRQSNITGSLSHGGHQETKRRPGPVKMAVQKALLAQDTAVPADGPREPHPGLFNRRNAADGTFTPARLPRCLESLFTAPLEASGRTRAASLPKRVLNRREMAERLQAFAKALESRDKDLSKVIERDLRLAVSQTGNAVQRVGFQFLRALKVRAATTQVEQLFQSPSHLQKRLVTCQIQYCRVVPLTRFSILAGMKHLCSAVRGNRRVSILVMGTAAECLDLYPELLAELAQRPEGPPEAVRLTTVEVALRPSAARELREKEERMREGARALRAQAWALGICGLECHHLAVDSVASLHRLLDIQDELCRPPCPSKDAEDSGDGGGERLREANREQGWERERERDRERRTGGCAPRESMGETSEVGGTRGNWKERGERKVKLEPAVEDSEDDSSALVALCVFAFSRVPSNSGSGGGRSKTSPCSVDVRAWIAKWLKQISPQRLVVVDLVADITAPSFLERFRACLQQFYSFFSHHDELKDWKEHPEIMWLEDHYMGQCIVNIVAGEGKDRAFHLEPRETVKSVLTKVGFEGSALDRDVVASMNEGLIGCNLQSFHVKVLEANTLALNWVGQPVVYMSSFS